MIDQGQPEFRVYSGREVLDVIESDHLAAITAVRDAYLAHQRGAVLNPSSQFLRPKEGAPERIIALPAAYRPDELGDEVMGIKWISSFPSNIEKGLARASAVLVLNDPRTGYPVACMEAAHISSTRTAASAILATKLLADKRKLTEGAIGIIGAGVISQRVLDFLPYAGLHPSTLTIFDQDGRRSELAARQLAHRYEVHARVASAAEEAIGKSDLVIIATTATSPHLLDAANFCHHPIVLHLSLRDLGPEIIAASHNVVDDIDHALQAATSLQLTETSLGHRDFVRYTLPDLLAGGESPGDDRTAIFSPFGMGVLDIAIANYVHGALSPKSAPIPDFFFGSEVER